MQNKCGKAIRNERVFLHLCMLFITGLCFITGKYYIRNYGFKLQWFIFPQFDGLAHSSTAKYYAIQSREEAQQYLNHPVLGKRLLECAAAVLAVEGRTILEIMGSPDNLKLNSSMTLFAQITNSNVVFTQVIDKYFEGKQDIKTIQLLEKLNKNANF